MDIFGGFLDAITPVTCPWWRRDSNPHSGLGQNSIFFLPPNSVQIYGHFWGLFFIFWMLLVAILTWFKSMDIFGGFLDAVTPVTCPWWRRDSNPHSGLGQNSIFFLPP